MWKAEGQMSNKEMIGEKYTDKLSIFKIIPH